MSTVPGRRDSRFPKTTPGLPQEENTSKTRVWKYSADIYIYLSIWSSLLENWNLSMSEHSSPKRMGDDPVSGMSWNNGWLWNVWPLGTPRIYDSSFALSRSVLVTLHLLVHVPTLWDLHTWVRPGGLEDLGESLDWDDTWSYPLQIDCPLPFKSCNEKLDL